MFDVGQRVKATEILRKSSFSIAPGYIGTVTCVQIHQDNEVFYNVDFTGNKNIVDDKDLGRNWLMASNELQLVVPDYMENIEVIREKFQESTRIYATSHDSTAAYYEGKMVGMIEGVAAMMGITWIEADVLLRKEN